MLRMEIQQNDKVDPANLKQEEDEEGSKRSYHSSDSDPAYEMYAMVKRTNLYVPDPHATNQ